MWTAERPGSMPAKVIYARNDGDRPVRITRLHLYDCVNVRNLCMPRDPEVVVAPGRAEEVATVTPRHVGRAWSFRYRYSWQTLEQDARQE